jgi:TonB family protein
MADTGKDDRREDGELVNRDPPLRAVVLDGPVSRLGLTRVPLVLLAICVALALTIFALVGMAARDWVRGRQDIRAAADAASTQPAALPRGPTAAKARGDEATWIGTDDYPPSAIRRQEEGTVAVSWTIGIDGRISNCHVTKSSGSPTLDAAGCAALVKRARYYPARDAQGRAVPTTKSRRISWRLPLF